jgi:hypothetical protein
VKALKRISDVMLVLTFVFVGLALVGPAWAWWVAAFCLAGSVVATLVRRRLRRSARPAAP